MMGEVYALTQLAEEYGQQWLHLYGIPFALMVIAVLLYVYFTQPTTSTKESLEENDWVWLDAIPRRRGKMLRKARREFVKLQAVDDFIDRVEEKVASGMFTRAEAQELYRDFRKCFPIRDAFPSQHLLKDAITRRLGTHTEAKFPDKKEKKVSSMFKGKPTKLAKA